MPQNAYVGIFERCTFLAYSLRLNRPVPANTSCDECVN